MTITPLMLLTLPDVNITPGPLWASELNDALTLIDVHDHTTGRGQKIPVTSLNINADFNLNNVTTYYNIINARSIRFNNNGAVLALTTDKGCIYEVSGDLWFNNAGGTPVQITAGSGLAFASLGTIGGDYGPGDPAAVTYSALLSAYVFTQDPGVTAGMSFGSIKIYDEVPSGKYVQLSAKSGIASDISLELPDTIPLQTQNLTMLPTGKIKADGNIYVNDPTGGKTVTITPKVSMLNDYSLELPDNLPAGTDNLLKIDSAGKITTISSPALPAVQSVVAVDNSGNMVDQSFYISPIYDISSSLYSIVGTITSISRARSHFYRLGIVWKMNFNIAISFSSASRNQISLGINNVSFAILGSGNIFYQKINAAPYGSTVTMWEALAFYNGAGISSFDIAHSANTTNLYILSGDIELTSKPRAYLPAGV